MSKTTLYWLIFSILYASRVLVDANADVEVGILSVTSPCDVNGGDKIEFMVLARQMNAVRQVSMIMTWHPVDAVVDVAVAADSALFQKGFIDFPAIIEGARAEFGMGTFDGGISGEAVLAHFSITTAPHITSNDRFDIRIDEITLGPEFTRHDTIRPLQAHILTNYCDASGSLLRNELLLSPKRAQLSFSTLGRGIRADSSKGEVRLDCSLFDAGFFVASQPITWSITNDGEEIVFVPSWPTLIHPSENLDLTTTTGSGGRTHLLFDAEAHTPGTHGRAKIRVCSEAGEVQRCAAAELIWGSLTTMVSTAGQRTTTKTIELGTNYPNPFNSSTTIPIFMENLQNLRIEVVNNIGQSVATIAAGQYPGGSHLFRWNGYNNVGKLAASGTYHYRLQTPDVFLIRPMLLLR